MAIHGRGDIASVITDKDGYIFYCNGVSNRLPLTKDAMAKEVTEVSSTPKDSMFVYISTLSIYYSNSEYTQHKMRMEAIIQKNFPNYCIFRIGNIKWGDNPNTLINKLGSDIYHKRPLQIKDEYRYIIDKEEFRHWISMIPQTGKHEMNVTGQRFKVRTIVEQIKNFKL